MMNRSLAIDPAWAWAAYVPSREAPWNRLRAAHLFRRASYGASWHELDEAVRRGPRETIARSVAGVPWTSEQRQEFEGFAAAMIASGNPEQLSAWWTYLMMETREPLRENMTLFWHGHFATSAEKVTEAAMMYRQNAILREHALGDFSAMVHAIARDPAMLVYLDSATNRKAHPNENFARELMELFCLGEGNYSERDIQELARCFTGWEIRRGRFRFNRFQHDSGEKQVLDARGAFPEGEAIDVVLRQEAAPRFIVRKLIKYLVFDEPEPAPELIEPLARELRDHDWNVGHVVQRILSSQLFFSEHALGRKVRSPVSLCVGLFRSLNGSANAQQLATDLRDMGQGLFYPPNVKGWDGGRAWINSARLLDRANAVRRWIRDEKTRFGRTTLSAYLQQDGLESPSEIVDRLTELLLAVPLADPLRAGLIDLAEDLSDPEERALETLHALCSLPEFHLC